MNTTCLGSLPLLILGAALAAAPPVTQAAGTTQDPGSKRAQAQRPKPVSYQIPLGWEPHLVSVKFRDGLMVRLRNGTLTDFGTGALAKARAVLERTQAGTWSRPYHVAEAELDRLRELGERNIGAPLHDLNLLFRCQLPIDVDATAIIDALNSLDCVERAESVPGMAPPPQAPDLRYKQIHSEPSPRGTGAGPCQNLPDFTNPLANLAAMGGNARIVNIEYGFDPLHVDLPPVAWLTPPGFTTPAYDEHGTAVLGVLGARDDGKGTTGMVPGAQLMFARAFAPGGVYDIDASIMTAVSILGGGNGGVILIEQQIAGPHWSVPGSQLGLVPVEWFTPTWWTIRNAVAAGVTVVEAAGNGSENLDHVDYGGWFSIGNDSGALLVGAGIAPPPSAPAPPAPPLARSRASFSNYGETLDLQGLGGRVTTTGYGDLYAAGGPHETYTQVFAGTSSASAVIAGVCAQVQSLHFDRRGYYLTPQDLRAALRRSSLPQTGANTQNIGPLPDAMRAVVELGLYSGLGVAHGFAQPFPLTGGNGIEFTGVESIFAMAEFDDDGPGSNEKRLYAAGQFTKIGGRPANNVAVWNGAGWQELGSGLNGTVRALVAYDPDGSGPQVGVLYAGGFFPGGVARWNPTSSTWTVLGSGLQGGGVYSLAMYGGAVVAGGEFTHAGALPVARIARFLSTWSPIGSGFDDRVAALEVYGGQLIAGGMFRFTGSGMPMESLATWNGFAWAPLGGGTSGPGAVLTLETIPIANSTQEFLFVGGTFWTMGGVWMTTPGLAVWTGGGWFFPATMASQPFAIVGFEDGSDPMLPRQRDAILSCATGQYRLDLTTWVTTTLPISMGAPSGPTECLFVFDEDGAGVEPPSLWLGGQLIGGGPVPQSAGIGKQFGTIPATTTGFTTIMSTGCGGPYQPTIAQTGRPVLGAPFTVQFDCLPMSLPAFCAGWPTGSLPLCPSSSCAIGVDPIAIDFGKQSATYNLPNEPMLVGVTLALQGIEFQATPYGPMCVPSFLPINLRTTDTLLLTF